MEVVLYKKKILNLEHLSLAVPTPNPPTQKLTHPPNYDNHGNGLGHYVKSYMKYIPSKFAFIGIKNAPETVLF